MKLGLFLSIERKKTEYSVHHYPLAMSFVEILYENIGVNKPRFVTFKTQKSKNNLSVGKPALLAGEKKSHFCQSVFANFWLTYPRPSGEYPKNFQSISHHLCMLC